MTCGVEHGLAVLKVGDTVFMRSTFSDIYDVVVSMRPGANRQMEFDRTTLVLTKAPMTAELCMAGAVIHGGGDSAPWYLNSTYIGANHGAYVVMQVTSSGHGLSASDLGGNWLDEDGVVFCLIRILDEHTLWFLSESKGSGDIWNFNTQLIGDKLEHRRNGTTLHVEKRTKNQLNPSCRITRQEILVNGTLPLVENEVVRCNTLDVVDEYDVINPASLLALIQHQAGRKTDFVDSRLEAVVSNRIRYQFQPQGTCVIHHTATARQSFDLGYMGFIQTRAMVRMKDDALDYYIPGTQPFKVGEQRYDFCGVQNFSERPLKPLRFSVANGNVESQEQLPARFVQFLDRKTGQRERVKAGYAFGYSLTRGMTQRAQRAQNCGDALVIHTSAKSYPHAVDKEKRRRIEAGETFDCVAYRRFFSPGDASARATCVYGYQEDDAYLLYADYHRSVSRDSIKLPSYLIGSTVTVVEAQSSVTIESGDTVPEAGLSVSVKDDYGYVVLRLVPPSFEKVYE